MAHLKAPEQQAMKSEHVPLSLPPAALIRAACCGVGGSSSALVNSGSRCAGCHPGGEGYNNTVCGPWAWRLWAVEAPPLPGEEALQSQQSLRLSLPAAFFSGQRTCCERFSGEGSGQGRVAAAGPAPPKIKWEQLLPESFPRQIRHLGGGEIYDAVYC